MNWLWTDRRIHLWILLALSALSVAFQAVLFKRQSLWADELFSLAIATGHSLEHPAVKADPSKGDYVQAETPQSLEVWRRYLQHDDPPAGVSRVTRAVFLSDTSPPLYYVLLNGWTRIFGANALTLRLFSLVCTLACVPLIYSIALRIGPPGAALIAAVLFLCSPASVYFCCEGRMYSLVWLLVLATAWVTIRLREQHSGIGWHLAWIALSAAGLMSHYFFLFPWLGMSAFLFLQPGEDRRWRLISRVVAVGLVVMPWYLKVPEAFASWRVTGDWLKMAPHAFSRVRATRDIFMQLLSGRAFGLWKIPVPAEVVAMVAVGIAAAVAIARLKLRIFAGNRAFIWMWMIAACLAPVAMDVALHTYASAVPRYALPALPAACLLMAGAFAAIGPRWRVLLVAALLASWSFAVASIARGHARSGQRMRDIAQSATGRAGASDVIIVHSIPSGVLGFAYYGHTSAPLIDWVGQLGTRRVPDSLLPWIKGRKRVVFASVHAVGAPAPEEDWLLEHATVVEEHKVGPGRIVVFRPKDSETF
jgi:hypothetical protein